MLGGVTARMRARVEDEGHALGFMLAVDGSGMEVLTEAIPDGKDAISQADHAVSLIHGRNGFSEA
jgi:hypothetical protein